MRTSGPALMASPRERKLWLDNCVLNTELYPIPIKFLHHQVSSLTDDVSFTETVTEKLFANSSTSVWWVCVCVSSFLSEMTIQLLPAVPNFHTGSYGRAWLVADLLQAATSCCPEHKNNSKDDTRKCECCPEASTCSPGFHFTSTQKPAQLPSLLR